jgi:hypothetical protein
MFNLETIIDCHSERSEESLETRPLTEPVLSEIIRSLRSFRMKRAKGSG